MEYKTIGPSRKFQNFNDAANQILKMLSNQMEINTLFIAENDGNTNRIKKAFNRKEELVTEDSQSPLDQTFCSLTINYGQEPLLIEDISKDENATKLGIAAQFDNGSFIGIPIYYEDGEVYGTICGLDKHPVAFTKEHQEMFEMMSSLLTYILELENAQKEIQTLSSPLVPLTDEISILPIIGHITLARAYQLIDDVVIKSSEGIDFLIMDFSGITQIDPRIEQPLLNLIKTLKIMGITPIITGILPSMAIQVPHFAHSLKGEKMEATLKIAIDQLGFVLTKKNEFDTSTLK
ncbi:GAF domain-containing protein [Planococcus sp. ISL-109]|uniref:GAF domain-containing protein n=1 Tax=Planococcus sp. ISL-109 TaxID=2819166 RepID=UPI001BEA448B|nr:GAF domain-containing protein [Planococcus sp. ISL-109]MBT2583185.1 GAF domain-containing protein [Planococcus sp. ISL-109]